MELRTITEEDSVVEIEVAGEDDTVLSLVREALLADDDVEVATYARGHPQLDKPKLRVETSSGDPLDKLEETVEAVRDEFDDLESDFLDAT